MTGDIISAHERLRRLSPHRWEHRLSLLFFVIALLLTLALMCENVNAAPQAGQGVRVGGPNLVPHDAEHTRPRIEAAAGPAGAAPFTLSHPLCATGFTMAQRIDTRDRFDWIVRRQWTVTGCAKGKIIYGGKSMIVPEGKKRNRPTELGKEAGANLSRLCDDAELTRTPLHPRCTTCAFRAGTIPNGCEATILDANKCLIEDTPFMCHERKGKPCSGWVTMRIKNSTIKAPWPFSYT